MTGTLANWSARHATSAAAWLAAIWTLSVTTHARAGVAPVVTVGVESPVPAGGVLIGFTACAGGCEAPIPQFFAGDGEPVGGRFVDEPIAGHGHRNFIFVPDPPLKPGTYSAFVSGFFNTSTTSFEVVDSIFELPTITHDIATETVGEGDLVQCKEQGRDSSPSWFTRQTRVRPILTVRVRGLYAKQYRYGIGLAGEAPTFRGVSPLRAAFNVAGDELCFEVVGYSYHDDEVTKIAEECMSLAGLGVGVFDEMFGNFRETLLGCVVPPDGYEDDWCAIFEPAFTKQSCDGFPLDSCFAARRACPNGDRPSAAEEQDDREARQPIAGTGAGGGTSGGGSTTEAGGTSGTGGSRGEPASPSAAGGCSLVPVRPAGPLNWLAWIAPLLIGMRACGRSRVSARGRGAHPTHEDEG